MPRQRIKPGTQDSNRVQRWNGELKKRRGRFVLHPGNAAGPQPPGPGRTSISLPYGVHMRNTSGQQRGTWATYAKAAREGALFSKAELSRRLQVDRGTIHRWESGATRPENPEVVQAFAQLLGLDLDEALAAAGLRPGVEAPAEPTREVDEEIELVRTDPKLDADMKRRIIGLILERRERDKAAALEETRRMIDLFRRG